MTTADVRDMLDLPSHQQPQPTKKQKTVEKRPEGITRELFALMGARAPPVAITDHVKYKERPKWSHKVQPWEMTPFTNPAREDGLVLRHWRRKRDPNAAAPLITPADGTEIEPVNTENQASQTESEYYFAKFNVKVQGPQYDDSQYEKHLHNADWSREETDYLVKLALDYDLRWVVIADRYDYQPTTSKPEPETSTALIAAPKKRTMEDLKARYYDLAAKTMALHRPVSSMSASEFDLHEKMTKFNAQQEITRKQLADALLSRSHDEIKEEEILLGELKRIVSNEEKFLQDRRELYDRLEPAPTTTSAAGAGAFTMFQSSNELGELMKALLTADKSKKRRLLLGPGADAAGSSSSPNGQPFGNGHRDSIGSTSAAAAAKRSSLSTNAHNASTPTTSSTARPLTAKEEAKYGVSHHERLTSGVQFRHDRVVKLGQAKSNVQASKISAALTELAIPPRLVMPTGRVCAEYERLIGSIHVLLDVRKVREKVEGEVRVFEAVREERVRREVGGEGESEMGGLERGVGGEEVVAKVEEEEEEEDNEDQGQDQGPEPKEEEEEEEDKEDEEEEDGNEQEEEGEEEEENENEIENENENEEEGVEEEKEDDDDDDDEEDAAADEQGEGDDADGEGASPTVSPSARAGALAATHKRSASVLSNVSQKSSKRLRK